MKTHRFSYTPIPGFSTGMPFVEIHLSHNAREISVSALVDSGAALNILPFDIGLELGFKWEKQTFPLDLGGVLKNTQAYAVVIQAKLDPFSSKDLGFAWVSKPSQEVRVLLGQVNFFQEFTVSFCGYQRVFDITPHPN